MPVGAGLLAILVVTLVGRAWLSGTNDPDSTNSVIYFQRIVAGERLELTVLTTPKPLLTLLYGATWNLFHDWRVLVWMTIAVHGVAVAAATRLATRLGGLAAGLFIAAALIASPSELTEVTHANSLPWALAGWAIAGLAVTSSPRRFWIAGAALLAAGLARTETWLIMAAGTAALAFLSAFRGRFPLSAPTVRTAAPLLIAWLALPIQWAHDYLLTGNAFYTLGVPAAYTALLTPHLAPVGPLSYLHSLIVRYQAMPVVIGLAAIGTAYLVVRRRWEILVPLVALIGGALALLGLLSWRAVYVSARYYEEPGLGLLFAAAIGAGALAEVAARSTRSSAYRPVRVIAAGLAVAIALAVTLPGGGASQLIQRTQELETASQSLESVLPALNRVVHSPKGVAPRPIARPDGLITFDAALVPIFVPGPFLGRIAVELDVPLTRLGDSAVAFLAAPPSKVLHPGQAIYHDAFLDVPHATFRSLEVTQPTDIGSSGSARLIPIAVRAGAYWLVRVED